MRTMPPAVSMRCWCCSRRRRRLRQRCHPPPPVVPGVRGTFGTDPVITMPERQARPGNWSSGPSSRARARSSGADDYVLFNIQGKVWAGNREVVDSFTDHHRRACRCSPPCPAWQQPGRAAGRQPGADGRAAQGRLRAAGRPAANIMRQRHARLRLRRARRGAEGDAHTPRAPRCPYHPARACPRVHGAAAGPEITVPATVKPPAKLVRQVLIRGPGRPIQRARPSSCRTPAWSGAPARCSTRPGERGFPESFVLGRGPGAARAGTAVSAACPWAAGCFWSSRPRSGTARPAMPADVGRTTRWSS